MVHSNPRGQGGLELSGCLPYLVSRITHHVDDVLWPFDSVLTTLKGAHDDESDESDEPSSFTPDTISYSGSPYRRVAKPLDIAPEHSRFAWRKIDIRYWPSVLLGKDISGLRRLHPWNAKIIAAVRPRWFIREGLPASLTRWMHQSTEKTVLEQSPQILVAALRPWQLATARRKSHLNPRFRRANCPRTGVLPRRTAAQSLGLAPANVSSVTSTESIHFLVCHSNLSAPPQTRRYPAGSANSPLHAPLVQLVALQLHPVKAPLELLADELHNAIRSLEPAWHGRQLSEPPRLRLFWETSGKIARDHRGLPDGASKQSEIIRTDTIPNDISLSQEFRICQALRHDPCDKMPSPTFYRRSSFSDGDS